MYKLEEMKNQVRNIKDTMKKVQGCERLSVAERMQIVQFYLEMVDIVGVNDAFNKEFNDSLNVQEVSA